MTRRPAPGAGPEGGRSSAGFTIVEALVVLGIVALLAGALVPLMADTRKRDRSEATERQLEALKEAIVGRRTPAEGAPSRTFGFLGDLGQLPDGLEQLVVRDGLPPFEVDPVSGLGVGWRGPYLPRRFADDPLELVRDAFGRPLRYAPRDTVLPDGTRWAGWIRSAGADGEFRTDDDLVAPLLSAEVRADLRGFLASGPGRTFEGAPVTVVFRRDGALVDTTVSTDSLGRFEVDGLAQGPVVVRAARRSSGQQTGFIRGSPAVSGNQFQDVSLEIANVSASPVTLDSVTVFVEEGERDRCYREFYVNGDQVLPTGGGSNIRCHGEPLVFATPVTLEAGTASGRGATRHEVDLAASTVLAPELALGGETGRATGTALVEFNDWRTGDGTGSRADMRGIELTVLFSDGLTITFEVPG